MGGTTVVWWRRVALVVVVFALPAVVVAQKVVPQVWPHSSPDGVQLVSDHSEPIRYPPEDTTNIPPEFLPTTTEADEPLEAATYPLGTFTRVVPGELQWMSSTPVRASGRGPARILNARPLTTTNLQHTEVRVGTGTPMGGGPVDRFAMKDWPRKPTPAVGAEIDATHESYLYVLGALGPKDTYGAFFGVRLTVLQDDRISTVDVPANGQLCTLPFAKDLLNPLALPEPCAQGAAAYPRQARRLFGTDDLG